MSGRIGPYEIRGELGRGAMAVVWRAFDPNLEREVAIKEPSLPPNADDQLATEFSSRFVREGRAAAALNHPGIVTIYGADVYDGRAAIIMELIEGETLSEMLCRGPLTPGAAVAILDQLLDAVGYAHSRGIVHRDIKPDNVFVTNEGRVKLADFGIAHVGSTAALTQAGTVMGTPGYMAPEQVMGQPTGAQADVFAVGVIAHELLTGRNPFVGDGIPATAVMYRIVHEQAPSLPADALASLPSEFAYVIATALAKEPSSRFVDAQAFRAALRGEPLPHAEMPRPVGAASQSTSSNAKLAYAAVAVIGVVAVGGLYLGSGVGGTAQPAGSGYAVQPTAPSPSDVADAQSTPEPEPEPEPAAEPQIDYAAVEQDIKDQLENWRQARMHLDFDTYINLYTDDFQSEEGKSYQEWYSNKQRIYASTTAPSITFSNMRVEVAPDAETATVTMTQTYSGSLNSTMTKRLSMRFVSGSWRIVSENE